MRFRQSDLFVGGSRGLYHHATDMERVRIRVDTPETAVFALSRGSMRAWMTLRGTKIACSVIFGYLLGSRR
jgi:hypothetical protein